jgi:ribose transport system permease protein
MNETQGATADAHNPQPSVGGGAPPKMGAKAIVVIALQRYNLALLFVLVVVVFSWMLPDSFATTLNFRNIIGNQSVLAIVGLAVSIPLIAGHFDFSVGSVLNVAVVAAASGMSRFGAPAWLAVLIGPAFGAAIGLFNGVIVTKVGVNSLILTLGVSAVLTGVITWYTKGQTILEGISSTFTDMGSGMWLGLPKTLYYLVAVALLVWYLLEHTPFGRYLYAVGSNPNAARLVGLQVDRIVILSFVTQGAMIGLAGVLQVARQGAGSPDVGTFILLPAFSAAFFGATQIHPGRLNVPGTILAVFFLATTVSGLSLAGVDNWVESAFNGTALIFAVALSTIVGRRRA